MVEGRPWKMVEEVLRAWEDEEFNQTLTTEEDNMDAISRLPIHGGAVDIPIDDELFSSMSDFDNSGDDDAETGDFDFDRDGGYEGYRPAGQQDGDDLAMTDDMTAAALASDMASQSKHFNYQNTDALMAEKTNNLPEDDLFVSDGKADETSLHGSAQNPAIIDDQAYDYLPSVDDVIAVHTSPAKSCALQNSEPHVKTETSGSNDQNDTDTSPKTKTFMEPGTAETAKSTTYIKIEDDDDDEVVIVTHKPDVKFIASHGTIHIVD